MEQRAQRARAPMPSTHPPADASHAWDASSPWPSTTSHTATAPPSPPPLAAMPPSTTRSATGGADVNTALLLHMDTATSRSGKRRVDEADTSAKSARTGDYHDVRPTYASASQTLDAMQELHPQLATAPDTSTAAPLVLDATLPFVLDAAAASTSASVPSSASAARLPLSASAPPTRARRSTARRQTRPLKPDQEKARAAFVAAHAGQTYEQMVLEHAYSSDRLFWLKEAYGLTWRTGRWSQDEEDRATDALNKFCKHYRLSQAALDELIWHRKPEQKHMHEELWKHIALSVGTRPNYAVRMHIKSLRKDVVRGGHWTQDEMEALASAVAELGHQWEKIGARLGRSGNVCKHFWREQMQSRSQGPVPQGAFRPEEEEALRQAVLECCEKVGCSPDGPNLPWTLIHERLGPSPRRISVLSRKWRGMLSAERRSSEEQNARWYAPHDDHILLQRIRAQGKQNAADIDFDQLATPEWQWPMYVIKKHWVVMLRKRAPPHFLGTLDELLDELARRVPSPEEYKMLASGRRPASAKAPHSTPVSASHDRGMPLPPPY